VNPRFPIRFSAMAASAWLRGGTPRRALETNAEMALKNLRSKKDLKLKIVILGPDGAGKSSVIEGLMRGLDQPGSRAVKVRHLKPQVILPQRGEPGAIVTNPHGKPPRSALTSLAKILVWLIEEWCAHLFQDKKQTLVICDRYYHDLLVDPLRYRYGGPLWIARLVGRLMPQPRLWVLLDAPAELLQARKQEVTRQESARQRQAYLAFVSQQRQYAIVDASQLLDKVTADVERVVAAIDCASAPMEKP
jgi:thymidylate kinase